MTAFSHETAQAIGHVIHERRVALDMTKTAAAERAGVSRRTWHEIEAGTRPASTAETLALFDQALQLPIGTLYAMTGKSASARIEDLRRQAIDLIRQMSGDDLEAFVGSQGSDSVLSTLRRLEADVAELRSRSERGTAGSTTVRSRSAS